MLAWTMWNLCASPLTLAENAMTTPMRNILATSHRGIFKQETYAATCLSMTTPTDGRDIPDKEDRAPEQVPRQPKKRRRADVPAEP